MKKSTLHESFVDEKSLVQFYTFFDWIDHNRNKDRDWLQSRIEHEPRWKFIDAIRGASHVEVSERDSYNPGRQSKELRRRSLSRRGELAFYWRSSTPFIRRLPLSASIYLQRHALREIFEWISRTWSKPRCREKELSCRSSPLNATASFRNHRLMAVLLLRINFISFGLTAAKGTRRDQLLPIRRQTFGKDRPRWWNARNCGESAFPILRTEAGESLTDSLWLLNGKETWIWTFLVHKFPAAASVSRYWHWNMGILNWNKPRVGLSLAGIRSIGSQILKESLQFY